MSRAIQIDGQRLIAELRQLATYTEPAGRTGGGRRYSRDARRLH